MFSFAVTAMASPTASRTASTTRRGKRARFSMGAAVPVASLVEVGAEERAEQVVVAEVDLDGVEPGGHRDAAPPGGSQPTTSSSWRRVARPDHGPWPGR